MSPSSSVKGVDTASQNLFSVFTAQRNKMSDMPEKEGQLTGKHDLTRCSSYLDVKFQSVHKVKPVQINLFERTRIA